VISLSFFTSSNVNIIELLKSKITKYYSINCQDTILDLLKTLKREFFTNNIHYEYYKKYIIPKLTRVKKTYTRRGKDYTCTLAIHMSKNYIILSFIELELDTANPYSHHTYLLGLNSDNKIFINRIPLPIDIGILNYTDKLYKDGIIVEQTGDAEIKTLLGYNVDIDLDLEKKEEITIDTNAHTTNRVCYRVQGEIIMCVERLDNIKELIHNNYETWELDTLEINMILELAYYELVKLGFNVTIRRQTENIIDIILRGLGKKYDKCKEYSKIITKILERKINNSYICSCNYCSCNYELNAEVAHIDSFEYYDLIIFVTSATIQSVRELIINDLHNQLINSKVEKEMIIIGNHTIELYNTIPLNFEYILPIELRLHVLPSTIRVTTNNYIVDSTSTIRLVHSEHGITTIKFNNNAIIEFTTTDIHNNYTSEINRIVMKNIIKNLNSILNSN